MTERTVVKKPVDNPGKKTKYQEDAFFILSSDSFVLDHFNKKLLSITPNVFYLFDIREEIYLFPNQCFEEFLGYPRNSFNPLNRQRVSQMMHPDDFAKYDCFITEVMAAKENTFVESQYRLLCKNGSWKWFMSKESVFMCDFENKPTHIFGVATDISKLKETEKSILNSRAQLNAIINSTTDRIWSIDRDFRLMKFNNPFKEYMKCCFNKEAVKGMNIFHCASLEDITLWTGYYSRSFKGERVHVHHVGKILGKDVIFETIIISVLISRVHILLWDFP